MMTTFLQLLRRLARDRRGNVLILAGFFIIPVIAFIGFCADYGTALADKAKLDAASDAAAIVAINTAQSALSAGVPAAAAIIQAQTAAKAAFSANAGAIAFATLPTPTVTIPPPAGLTVTATVTYATSTATQFSKVLGMSSIPVAGTSVATLTMPTYQNYYVLLDISQSMGIAATQNDMNNLYNRSVGLHLSQGGCVFACHTPVTGDPYSMEYVAHNPSFGAPITLRLDSAMSAVQDMVNSAQASQANSVAGGGPSNLIQIGLYTMSGFAALPETTANTSGPPSGQTNMLNAISPPTSNFKTLLPMTATPASSPLSSATPVVDLGDNNAAGYGDSYMSNANNQNQNSLSQFYSSVLTTATNGSGATPTTPQNFVIIITDGVDDEYGNCAFTHCVAPLDPTLCAQLKTKATVGVIYTTYNPIYTNNDPTQGLDFRYTGLIQPLASQIAPALQACASSPLFYFEASDGPSITTGMRQLMANSQLKARLTQ
jgi:Flp pilus assembly protein TadG